MQSDATSQTNASCAVPGLRGQAGTCILNPAGRAGLMDMR